MPQMMPISWLMLFMYFSISFMLINMMNYFFYMPISNTKNVYINSKVLYWKW
nr:ATP synthase F0 subunit 8 [Allacta transversa]